MMKFSWCLALALLLAPIAAIAQDAPGPMGQNAPATIVIPTLPPLATATPTPIFVPTFPTLPPLATATPTPSPTRTPIIIPTFPTLPPLATATPTATPWPDSLERISVLSPARVLDEALGDRLMIQGVLNAVYTYDTRTGDTWMVKTASGLEPDVLHGGCATGDIYWMVADGTACTNGLWRTDGTPQGTFLYEGLTVQSLHNFPQMGVLAMDTASGLYLYRYDPAVPMAGDGADVNGDGIVDPLDLLEMAVRWHGPGVQP